jgi:phospholipase C
MIEWRFGLPALTVRDAAAANLAEALDFAAPPNLTAPAYSVPSAVSAPCGTGTAQDYEEWRKLAQLAASYGFSIGS